MRIGIVGMGWVGTSVAASLLTRAGARELYLNDIRPGLAEGEAMDLSHAVPFLGSASVKPARVDEMHTCDAIVIAAGRNGRPNESRLDLLRDNATVVRALGEQLRGFPGLLVMVTNPVDVLTHVLLAATGLPPTRVIGSGTLLDTARMRHLVGTELGVSPQSVHMNVLGEHGDSQVAAFSSARVGTIALRKWPSWDRSRETSIADRVRWAAREIIARKGATNHAIGLATAYLLKWALADEQRVLTVSRLQEGAAGLHDVCISLPAVVGRSGATRVLEPELDPSEHAALSGSADLLRQAYASVRTS
jgi:L-lactate dehydrogenase